jgi:hypothetical protein
LSDFDLWVTHALHYLPEWISDFKDIFTPQKHDELPPFCGLGLDYEINLKPNAPSISPTKLIRLPQAQQEIARKLVNDDLEAMLIQPLNSPYALAAPMFFVPKHNGSLRPVLDYHWVNSHTIHNKWPLPCINDIIDQLQASKHFTKLDT